MTIGKTHVIAFQGFKYKPTECTLTWPTDYTVTPDKQTISSIISLDAKGINVYTKDAKLSGKFTFEISAKYKGVTLATKAKVGVEIASTFKTDCSKAAAIMTKDFKIIRHINGIKAKPYLLPKFLTTIANCLGKYKVSIPEKLQKILKQNSDFEIEFGGSDKSAVGKYELKI